MIMLACLINAFANMLNFVIWYKAVKDKRLKAHDAKGYFMILAFGNLIITFAVGMIGQETLSTYLLLVNTAISLAALSMAFVLIKDPVQY